MKYLFNERSEKGHPDEPLLVASQNMGVVPKTIYESRTVEAQKDLHLLKLVRIGDFVISLRSFQGGLEYAYYQGIISPAYTILIPHEPMTASYFRYLAKSKLFIGLLTLCVTGIREGQNIDYSKLRDHLLPVPPRDEQDQIVRYLDWQVSKINRLIAAKRKEIGLTREYISVKIEDVFNTVIGTSSVVLPLGRHIRRIESGTSVNSIMGTADVGIPGVLSTSCVYGNHFDASQNKQVAPIDYERVSCPVRKNTVIVSRMNTPSLVGACGFSNKDIDNIFLPDRLWQVHFDDTIIPEFAWRYLSRQSVQSWFATIATGSSNTMKNITKPQFKAVLIPNIDLEKQKQIIEIISKIIGERDAAHQLQEQTISNLQALRTRLISDVVTGQIDVRGVDIPDFAYAADDGAPPTDPDEDMAGAAFAAEICPAITAEQLRCQQIIILRFVTARGFFVLFQLFLYPVKQLLWNDRRNSVRNHNIPESIFPDVPPVSEHQLDIVEVHRFAH